MLELDQVVAALLGAAIALWAQALTRRSTRVRAGQRLSMALWEELSAVHFYGPLEKPTFAGFSSQTFDTLFSELADSLPETLARDLMRYHWRMKYMEDMKRVTVDHINSQFWTVAKDLNADLRTRLNRYAQRNHRGVFAIPSERPRPKAQLRSAPKTASSESEWKAREGKLIDE